MNGTEITQTVKILLAEDEEFLRKNISLNFEMEGYHVVSVNSGTEAINMFKKSKFDLIVLDIMMPEINGISVCETIRLEDTQTPILFLTAKGTGSDRIAGLKAGADDYLVKPFNLEELLLRVSNLLKRTYRDNNSGTYSTLKFGNNSINFNTFEITDKNGKANIISKKEILLLKLLADKKNEVVSRKEILDKVWGYDSFPTTRTIDNYILQFRKYFEESPKAPRFFHSIRGVGYKFTP
jgi:two-component system, OmpR family, alkaline phosphatase synthesis response regulator PhoP